MTAATQFDWETFAERLEGPGACNWRDATPENLSGTYMWDCGAGTDTTHAQRILADMGLSAPAVAAMIAFFAEHGGHCDCEISMNVLYDHAMPARPEEWVD